MNKTGAKEMDGRKKRLSMRMFVGLPLGITLLIFLGALAYMFYNNTLNIVLEGEHENIRHESDSIAAIVSISTENIQAVTRDWACWDETYDFALGTNPSHIEEKLVGYMPLQIQKLNFVVLKDLSGNVLYEEFYDFIDMSSLAVPEGFSDFLSPLADEVLRDYRLQSDSDSGSVPDKHGFAVYNDTAYYISSLPILKDDESGPPAGTLFFGRIYDEREIIRITNESEMNFAIVSEIPLEARGTCHNETDNNTIIYKTLPGFLSDSTTALRIQNPRNLYQQGMRSIRFTIALMFVLMLLFIAALFYLLERNVLHPLGRLSSDVQSITDDSASIDTGPYSSSKELFALGTSINDTLNKLAQSRQITGMFESSLGMFKSVLNGIDAYLYVSDPETDEILFINDLMRKHFGLGEDAVGQICWKVLQSGFEKRCDFCPNSRLMENPDVPIVWEEHNTVTGHFYTNSDRIIEWSDGRKVHLQHSIDITESKQTEALLKRRLEQQELMSSISQSFITDDDTDVFIANALQMTGEFMNVRRIMLAKYDEAEEALKLKYLWSNKDVHQTLEYDHKLSFKEGSFLYEAFMTDKRPLVAVDDVRENEEYKHIKEVGVKSFFALPVFVSGELWGVFEADQGGDAYAWSESDIHLGSLIGNLLSGIISRKNAQKNILRMSSIINSSPQYISYVNKNGDFEFFNPATLEITGYSHDELMAGGLSLLFDEESSRRIIGEIMPLIYSKGRYDFEFPLTRKDGEIRTMAFSSFTIESDENSCGSIATDITQRKLLEQELIGAKEIAEQASRAKGDFLSRMSHEMRTPMNAIIGMTSIAKETGDLKKKQHCLDMIDNASKHLLSVINDILDMSKIEADKFDLYAQEFNFEKMLIDITNVISFKAEERNQELAIYLDKDVPLSIIGDELRLTQVITNLLSNAVKFTHEGGSIALSAKSLGEQDGVVTLQIEVADNGIGVSKEQQAHLFTAFEQADGGISRKFGGTGLGLAISKRIVELMGGEIWIESELGSGSKFIFTIKAEKGKSKLYPELHADINKENLRILAVDDSAETREYFLHVMETLKLPCDVAADAYEALDLINDCKGKPYNIFFIDWQMPGMNGIELTRKIKEIMKDNAVVIMISASEWQDIEKEATDAKVDHFIPKPLFPSTIVDSINKCLGTGEPVDIAKKKPSSKANFKGHSILLAEDMDVNREIMESVLKNMGISVGFAENGLEAVSLFKENPGKYSLILMDIQMPEMDGYEATLAIRALDYAEAKNIPIIAMTANVFREDIDKCLAAGMNDHIGKPIDTAALLAKLRLYLTPKKAAANKPPKNAPGADGASGASGDYSEFLPAINVSGGLIRLMNNKKLYFGLLRDFPNNRMTGELIKNINESDFGKTAQTAHALKGVSANLGLVRLMGIFANIENQAKAEIASTEMADALKDALDEAITAINTLVEREGIR